jgi:2-polyprenyl-3-methyl-5-hydroxy-6-metoxy-1,4-benzoquinol methylase
MRNLKELLIKHQHEYTREGLESGVIPESDEVFYSTWIHHRMRMLSLIPEECHRSGTEVLDLGGGKGRMAALLGELGLKCTIVDTLFKDESEKNISGQTIVHLWESYLKNKGVQVVAHDFLENGIPFADETFKLVIFSEVIEHLPNSPKPVLVEISRVLTPGGWLILTTPNVVSMANRKRFLLGRSVRTDIEDSYNTEDYSSVRIYKEHIREFTRKEVEYMLGQENFEIVKSMTCDYRGPNFSYGRLKRTIANALNGIRYLPKTLCSDLGNFIVILARKL